MRVGDGQADFMQLRRPQQGIPVSVIKAPVFAYLVKQVLCGFGHFIGLFLIYAVTGRDIGNGRLAYILVLVPADKFIQDPFPQGAVGYLNMIQVERLNDGVQDGDTSGKDRFAAFR